MSGNNFGEIAMVVGSMASELMALYGELSSLISLMGRVWKMLRWWRWHQVIIWRRPSVSPMPRSSSVRMAKTGSRMPAKDCSGLNFIFGPKSGRASPGNKAHKYAVALHRGIGFHHAKIGSDLCKNLASLFGKSGT